MVLDAEDMDVDPEDVNEDEHGFEQLLRKILEEGHNCSTDGKTGDRTVVIEASSLNNIVGEIFALFFLQEQGLPDDNSSGVSVGDVKDMMHAMLQNLIGIILHEEQVLPEALDLDETADRAKEVVHNMAEGKAQSKGITEKLDELGGLSVIGLATTCDSYKEFERGIESATGTGFSHWQKLVEVGREFLISDKVQDKLEQSEIDHYHEWLDRLEERKCN